MTERYDVAFIESADCDRDVAAFRFEKPAGYTFLPGQFMQLTLKTPEGEESKYFTLSSAPPDPYLELTTRLSGSAFKDALDSLSPGDRVTVSAAQGRNHLKEGERRAVFLAGGIGITPARSILRDSFLSSNGLEATLFFGNKDDTCVPYRVELDEIARKSADVTIVYVFERPPEGWTGETGFITAETILRHVDPAEPRRWFVAGPPIMVDVMVRILDQLGIPRERRSVESFTGY